MSKRLQVLLADEEMDEIRRLAGAEQLSVGSWVRRALRQVRERNPARAASAKLEAIRHASQFSSPVSDIQQMLDDVERGDLA